VTVRAIVKLITQVCEQLLPSKKSLRFNLRRGARRQEIEIIGSNIDKNAVWLSRTAYQDILYKGNWTNSPFYGCCQQKSREKNQISETDDCEMFIDIPMLIMHDSFRMIYEDW